MRDNHAFPFLRPLVKTTRQEDLRPKDSPSHRHHLVEASPQMNLSPESRLPHMIGSDPHQRRITQFRTPAGKPSLLQNADRENQPTHHRARKPHDGPNASHHGGFDAIGMKYHLRPT